MKEITIYTTSYCGYCNAAKSLLKSLDLPYTEIDVSNDTETRMRLVEQTGQRTVPQIFLGQQAIGGYTDLVAIRDSGRLDGMLAED